MNPGLGLGMGDLSRLKSKVRRVKVRRKESTVEVWVQDWVGGYMCLWSGSDLVSYLLLFCRNVEGQVTQTPGNWLG